MAVRVALGAGRLRAGASGADRIAAASRRAGGLLGVFLAYFGADALVRIMTSGRPMPGCRHASTSGYIPMLQVLLFTAGVALMTVLLFGLAPAWNAFASAPASSLRADRRRRRDQVAATVRQRSDRRPGGPVGRAPERRRPIRPPSHESSNPGSRLRPPFSPAGDVESTRQRLSSASILTAQSERLLQAAAVHPRRTFGLAPRR